MQKTSTLNPGGHNHAPTVIVALASKEASTDREELMEDASDQGVMLEVRLTRCLKTLHDFGRNTGGRDIECGGSIEGDDNGHP